MPQAARRDSSGPVPRAARRTPCSAVALGERSRDFHRYYRRSGPSAKPACSIEDTRPWIIALRLHVLSARRCYVQLTTSIDITTRVTARRRRSTGWVGRTRDKSVLVAFPPKYDSCELAYNAQSSCSFRAVLCVRFSMPKQPGMEVDPFRIGGGLAQPVATSGAPMSVQSTEAGPRIRRTGL